MPHLVIDDRGAEGFANLHFAFITPEIRPEVAKEVWFNENRALAESEKTFAGIPFA